MIGLIILAIFVVSDSGKVELNPQLKDLDNFLKKNRAYLAPCLIFLIVLLTLFHSENVNDLFWQLKLKLPFLLLPLAFLLLPVPSKKQYYGLYYFMIFLVGISSIFVLGNYYLNFEEITTNIGKGQSIPTPIDHIKFSITVAISIVAGIILIVERFRVKYSWERPVLIATTAFLFVFIHILSVRSGLATLYGCLFIMGIRYFAKSKNKLVFLVSASILAAAPFVSYQVFPSFKNKVNYMLWDLKKFKEGGQSSYSDSDRIRSIVVGWKIAGKSPILGVGYGDIREESRLKYIQRYGHQAQSLFPHNEYLTVLVASGVIGLMLFLFALFQPLYYNKAYTEPLFLSFSIIIWLSFIVENTIERSYSIGLYLIFTLAAIHYIRGTMNKKP